MSTTRKKKPETRGRPKLPRKLCKVTLVCRVPAHVRDGFDARAAARGLNERGKPKSSRGIEVERAFASTH